MARPHVTLALLALWLIAPTAAADPAGSYQVRVTTYRFVDSTGVSMTAVVYYPSARHNGAALPEGLRFPATMFLQGANVDAARYTWLGELASAGYVVVLPDKYPTAGPRFNGEPGINPNTKLTSVDVMDGALRRLHAWAAEPTSPLASRFDGRVAIAGHSQGGYAAIIGVDVTRCPIEPLAVCPVGYQLSSSVVAMWLIGGHREGNGDLDPGSLLLKPAGFPVYLIAGERDGIATPAEVEGSWRRYAFPKRYWRLAGANHFGWTDYLSPEDNLRDEQSATITPAQQQSATREAVRLFLDCELRGDARACAAVPTTAVP